MFSADLHLTFILISQQIKKFAGFPVEIQLRDKVVLNYTFET
jgi:hypothetical protein